MWQIMPYRIFYITVRVQHAFFLILLFKWSKLERVNTRGWRTFQQCTLVDWVYKFKKYCKHKYCISWMKVWLQVTNDGSGTGHYIKTVHLSVFLFSPYLYESTLFTISDFVHIHDSLRFPTRDPRIIGRATGTEGRLLPKEISQSLSKC